MMRTPITPAAFACLALSLAAGPAAAQQQQVKPPIAQYWIDLSTHTMAGMPEMPTMAGIPGMPGMAGGGGNSWGMARAMAMGRHIDLALYTRARPSGSEAAHAIPPGVKMGPSLPLVPVQRVPTTREPGEPTEDTPTEKPTGRLLIYWGCGETVRPGQPRVIDLAGNPAEMGRALGGRYAPDRGARATPGYSLWPNERSNGSVPRDASIVGEHAITGDGVPAGMRFAIGQAHDLMPAIELASTGRLSDSVALKWQPVRGALAHYLHAMGAAGNDMVLWSSAETPDTGMGLFDYLSGATIDKWVREKVLLPAAQTTCAVPKGIFAGGKDDGAMLRMISYGPELNLAHPPRPSDPRTPWEPDWALRLRVKASTMAMLGEDVGPSAGDSPRAPGGAQESGTAAAAGQPSPAEPAQGSIPGLPGVKPADILKGIFGR
jgi:hypothetical protein